jgi:cyanophycinase
MNRATRRRPLPLLLLLVLASACGGAVPGYAPEPAPASAARGTLYIVGGGTQTPAMVERFVELAGGARRARIAVVPMASGEPVPTGREKADDLRRLGADAFVLHLTREQAMGDSAARLLEGVTGVWFSGGDQARLLVLRGTPVLDAIRRRYQEGAVIGGTSAGAAVMSDSMLTGNQWRPGEAAAGYFGDEYPRVARASAEIVAGLGLLPGTIVDQHFLRRERHNRLLSAVLERPGLIGVGIDESTALVVHPGGIWTVEGESAVLIVDARHARITEPGARTLGAADARLHLLPPGGGFDPRTGRAWLAPRM